MSNIQASQIEYIPFQTLTKAKAYKILNYGRTYDKYTRYRISENPEHITDIYVDDEHYIKFTTPQDGSSARAIDESHISHHVEIHYSATHNQSMKACILTNAEIDLLVAKYGCKL
jgi:hypothetical protein